MRHAALGRCIIGVASIERSSCDLLRVRVRVKVRAKVRARARGEG